MKKIFNNFFCLTILLVFSLHGSPLYATNNDQIYNSVKQARDLTAQGKFQASNSKLLQALKTAKTIKGFPASDVGYITADIGANYTSLNDLNNALRYLQEAVTKLKPSLGEDNEDLASIRASLGRVLYRKGQFVDAEKILQKALKTFKSRNNSERSLSTGRSLAIIYKENREYEKGIQLLQGLKKQPSNQTKTDRQSLQQTDILLAEILTLSGKAKESESLLNTVIKEAGKQGDESTVLRARYELANAKITDGKLSEAEALLDDLLKRLAKGDLSEPLLEANATYYKGYILIFRGLYVDAEPVFRKAYGLYKNHFGGNHPIIGRVLHNLALVHESLNNPDLAGKYFDSSIKIQKGVFGEDSIQVASTLMERVLLDIDQNKNAQAEKRARKSVQIFEKAKNDAPLLKGISYVALGKALQASGKSKPAIDSYEKAVTTITAARHDNAKELYLALIELGTLYTESGKTKKAEDNFKKVIGILERDRAYAPSKLPTAFIRYAALKQKQGKQKEALELSRKSTNILQERAKLSRQLLSQLGSNEQRVSRDLYSSHVSIAVEQSGTSKTLLDESFKVAQAAQVSTAANRISTMAARFAARGDGLGKLVRKHQKLLEQWRIADDKYTRAISDQDVKIIKQLKSKLLTIEKQLAVLTRDLNSRFPEYQQLTNPLPISIKQVQSLLKPKEALALVLTSGQGTYVWLVGKSRTDVISSPLSNKELDQYVRRIRASVELNGNKLKPFDTKSAYLIYKNLFEPHQSELKKYTKLLVVADGSLQRLPIGLLLSSAGKINNGDDYEGYSKLSFFAKTHAISILPSVSALSALRSIAQSSKAKLPLIGFGDPIFSGHNKDTRNLTLKTIKDDTGNLDIAKLKRGLSPLPESRKELQSLAKSVGGADKYLFFGKDANESQINNAKLDNFKIVTFATHALVANEFSGVLEPSLVLSIPNRPKTLSSNIIDDGLLTSSEVATLNLNADWVILSACNTAAPNGVDNAEGLSGLAQAFFFAGARSMLVSHWAVNSLSAVETTTNTMKTLKVKNAKSKAEALQLTRKKMISGQPQAFFAHPSMWAPFVLIGD